MQYRDVLLCHAPDSGGRSVASGATAFRYKVLCGYLRRLEAFRCPVVQEIRYTQDILRVGMQ